MIRVSARALIYFWTLRVSAYFRQGLISFLRNNWMFKATLEDEIIILFEGIIHSHRHNSWQTQMRTTVFVMLHYVCGQFKEARWIWWRSNVLILEEGRFNRMKSFSGGGRFLIKTHSKWGTYSKGGAYWKESAKSNHYGKWLREILNLTSSNLLDNM